MNFGVIILTQNMETEQNFITEILIALLFTLKPNIFLKIFPMMLRDGFIRLTMIKMPLPIGKNKEVPGLFKDELGGKVIIEAVARRPKTYAYLIDDGSEHKKSKGTKRCVIKQKIIFQNLKNCLFNKFIDHRKDLKAIIMMCTQKK